MSAQTDGLAPATTPAAPSPPMADIPRTVASQIISARTARDWTQRDLAAASGVRVNAISAAERFGNASLLTLTRLARALDVGLVVHPAAPLPVQEDGERQRRHRERA